MISSFILRTPRHPERQSILSTDIPSTVGIPVPGLIILFVDRTWSRLHPNIALPNPLRVAEVPMLIFGCPVLTVHHRPLVSKSLRLFEVGAPVPPPRKPIAVGEGVLLQNDRPPDLEHTALRALSFGQSFLVVVVASSHCVGGVEV